MCDLEKGKICGNYSTCPILLSITQRSYANRALDNIFKSLDKIEKLLEELVTNGKEK